MLPFDRKPWAKTLARIVIAVTLLGIAAVWIYLRTLGALDTGEYLAFFLIALAIIPTNLAVIYRKDAAAAEEHSPSHEGLVQHGS
jgi:uncharacterized sodium:solute symporter family permease YidK